MIYVSLMAILSFSDRVQCTDTYCIQYSPTATVQINTYLRLFLGNGPKIIQSLTPMTMRFREPHSSNSIEFWVTRLNKSSQRASKSPNALILYAREKMQFLRFNISPGRAETLVTRGGIANHHSIAFSLSDISAKNYQNQLMCDEDIVVIFDTSVVFETVEWACVLSRKRTETFSPKLWCFCEQLLGADDIADAAIYILSAKPHVQVILRIESSHLKQNDNKIGRQRITNTHTHFFIPRWSSLIEFGITGYYNPDRLRYAGTRDADL